jgi:hypothetical protein
MGSPPREESITFFKIDGFRGNVRFACHFVYCYAALGSKPKAVEKLETSKEVEPPISNLFRGLKILL